MMSLLRYQRFCVMAKRFTSSIASTLNFPIEMVDDKIAMQAVLRSGLPISRFKFRTNSGPNSKDIGFYKAGAVYPDLCWQVSDLEELSPMAVKIGRPLTLEEKEHFKPEQDILVCHNPRGYLSLVQVVREPSVTWKPPKTSKNVLDTQSYAIYQTLLHLASRDMKPFNKQKLVGPKESHFPFKCMEGDMERLQGIIYPSVAGRDHEEQLRSNHLFVSSVNTAIRTGWRDSKGRKATSNLLTAAADVCHQHMIDLNLTGAVPENFILMDVDNIGGGTDGGEFNSNIAIRRMGITDELTFADQVKAYQDPDNWVETNPKLGEEPWFYKSFTPDVALWVQRRKFKQSWADFSFDIDGLLTGEVLSNNSTMDGAVNQAVAHAMQGLLYRPCAAAVVMGPKDAAFIDIAVNDSFIDVRKKYYNIATNDVNPEAYEELFHDLVLYLWNTYFERIV